MIPARKGSERLKNKNFFKLQDEELVRIAIKKAKVIELFDKIYLNTDTSEFEQIAVQESVNFYLRPKKFGLSHTPSDEVVWDFFLNHKDCEILVWINAVSPLQKIEEIEGATKYFIKNNLDSLITSHVFQRHANYNNLPLNYDPKNDFARTQDLPEVELFSYSTMIFRRKSFLEHYAIFGNAFIFGQFSTFKVDFKSFLAIKTIEDFYIVESIYNSDISS